MSMSDCVKCWDTPCTCGWEHRKRSIENLEKQVEILQKAIKYKKQNNSAVFSNIGEKETDHDKQYMLYLST